MMLLLIVVGTAGAQKGTRRSIPWAEWIWLESCVTVALSLSGTRSLVLPYVVAVALAVTLAVFEAHTGGC